MINNKFKENIINFIKFLFFYILYQASKVFIFKKDFELLNSITLFFAMYIGSFIGAKLRKKDNKEI